MKPLKVALVSYSFGKGNGIARMDESIVTGIHAHDIDLSLFVIHADFPSGCIKNINGNIHISLIDAFYVLYKKFLHTDIVQFNGAFDPVVCNAAIYAGVPAIIEVVHQVETGAMSESVDIVVSVSDIVNDVQTHRNLIVIENGIDCGKFSVKYGRRHKDKTQIIQVSNSGKDLYVELGMIVDKLSEKNVKAYSVGDRFVVGHVIDLGIIDCMPNVYHDSDILFLLEKKSAFGLVFAEAMACGTLPIASSTSGAVKFIQNTINGFIVDYNDEQDAINTLNEAIEVVHTQKFIDMQKNARELIECRYNRRHMLQKYLELWRYMGRKARKEIAPPAAWMRLATAALLFKAGNPAAIGVFEQYLAEKQKLEAHFLRHPAGQATLIFMLSTVCPYLLQRNRQDLVRHLCAKLRDSRCISPLLTTLESQV